MTERFLKAKRALFDKYYSFLNEKQREAIYTVNGPVLILAGAGSGKTTVLVNRIAHIIKYGDAYNTNEIPDFVTPDTVEDYERAIALPSDELRPYLSPCAKNPCKAWGILAFTFTNKAAGEIKERLEKILEESASDIWSGTFHSVCVRILRKHCTLIGYRPGFGICDMDDAKKQISRCMKDLGINEKFLTIKSVMNEISRAKDKLQPPEEYAIEVGNDAKFKSIARVYELYQKRLKESNVFDFDDIIMKTVELFTEHGDILAYYQNKFKYVLVDEYQDTNKAQFVLVSLLAGFYKNIMVVGDDDQSIYKFRGATIENILSFDSVYENAKVIKLEQNYRSTSNILNSANCVIKNNPHKHQKELWCVSDAGEKIILKETYTQNDEANYIIDQIASLRNKKGFNYNDFAILYRMNSLARSLETAFVKSGVPYRVLGTHRFYDHAEIRDIVAYLSVINNPTDTVRLTRIVNEPKRKIGDTSFNNAVMIAEGLGISAFEVLERADSYNAIPTGAAKSMVAFTEMIKGLQACKDTMPLSAFVRKVMKDTGYEDALLAKGQEVADKLENLDQLAVAAKEFEDREDDASLTAFLEEIALVSDVDKYDEDADAVVLMTIHSAKGLEFPVVFLPAMEEGVFPGQQSLGLQAEIEEERRLAYVAITRAKKILYLLHAKERMLNGMTQRNLLSRFVKEIDEKYLDIQKIRVAGYGGFTQAPRPQPQQKLNGFFSSQPKKPEKKDIVVFGVGERVHHMTFGEGTVIGLTPMSTDYMYEIAFDNVGTKKLMASYVSKLLKKI